MNEQIEKILKFVEITSERKNFISNFEDVKNQVSVLLMNEVFSKNINDGMKITLLNVVSSILFENDAKAEYFKTEHEWGTFYTIASKDSKILFDPIKAFVQISDATTEKETGNIVIYKCSKDVMTRTTSIGKEIETIVYDEIGLQKNKIIRGISIPGEIPYEEHITRDDNDLTTIFVNEALDSKEPFFDSIKKVSRIWEIDTSVNGIFQGNEEDLESILLEVNKNIEEETEYKYFPELKQKILNKLSLQFTNELQGNKKI